MTAGDYSRKIATSGRWLLGEDGYGDLLRRIPKAVEDLTDQEAAVVWGALETVAERYQREPRSFEQADHRLRLVVAALGHHFRLKAAQTVTPGSGARPVTTRRETRPVTQQRPSNVAPPATPAGILQRLGVDGATAPCKHCAGTGQSSTAAWPIVAKALFGIDGKQYGTARIRRRLANATITDIERWARQYFNGEIVAAFGFVRSTIDALDEAGKAAKK